MRFKFKMGLTPHIQLYKTRHQALLIPLISSTTLYSPHSQEAKYSHQPLSLIMRIPLVALGAIASCLWPTAALPNDYANAANLDARAGDVCKAVKVIVRLLKANKATPFCSSFLGIPSAGTSTTTATAFAETVETSTTNVITEVPTYYTTV